MTRVCPGSHAGQQPDLDCLRRRARRAGSARRYILAAGRFGQGFPIGTLTVNATGSLLLGLIGTLLAERVGLPAATPTVLGRGISRRLTTFSTFAFETMTLNGWSAALALANVLLNNLLSLAGVLAGVWVARLLLR